MLPSHDALVGAAKLIVRPLGLNMDENGFRWRRGCRPLVERGRNVVGSRITRAFSRSRRGKELIDPPRDQECDESESCERNGPSRKSSRRGTRCRWWSRRSDRGYRRCARRRRRSYRRHCGWSRGSARRNRCDDWSRRSTGKEGAREKAFHAGPPCREPGHHFVSSMAGFSMKNSRAGTSIPPSFRRCMATVSPPVTSG